MTLALFLFGLLAGAAGLAILLVPRLSAAVEAERAARSELEAAHLRAEHAARLAAERQSAHECRLAELRAATEEKVALVSGNREQLAEQMKAISSDTLRQVSAQVERLAAAQREADRATAAGELSKRTEEIKRTLDPIAQNL
ncbi:MAG: recombination protein RmuC, partial [Solirubrobacteraceae bacterium]|nr:recombination protein RmuC [Solirubrobacteraceae bacterium]